MQLRTSTQSRLSETCFRSSFRFRLAAIFRGIPSPLRTPSPGSGQVAHPGVVVKLETKGAEDHFQGLPKPAFSSPQKKARFHHTESAALGAASMVRRQKKAKRSKAKSVLRLPDLEQSKNAVLNSLAAATSQESYGHAINEFIGWYCSEPRLAFNRTVVLRYRFFLEQKNLAPSTINVRLAAVRRLAYAAEPGGLPR